MKLIIPPVKRKTPTWQLPSGAPQLDQAPSDKGEPYYDKQGTWKDQEKSNNYR